MTKTFATLLALSALFATSACMEQHRSTDLAPGTYKSTTKSTDANGTNYSVDKTTDVSVDEYGNKRAVVSKKTTKDPKGLMNKQTSKSKTVVEDNGY